jgi:hypothetical protein
MLSAVLVRNITVGNPIKSPKKPSHSGPYFASRPARMCVSELIGPTQHAGFALVNMEDDLALVEHP